MWTPILREVTDDDGGEKWALALTLSREKGCPYMEQVSLPASGTGRGVHTGTWAGDMVLGEGGR